jgi:thiamine-monophosphate kinase
VGDQLFVSGEVGGFAAALAYFAARSSGRDLRFSAADTDWLRARLIRPTARVALGRQLVASGSVSAMMDITDGLGQTLVELTEASGAGATVALGALPINPITRAVCDGLNLDLFEVVFGVGLDLELVGALRGPLPLETASAVSMVGQIRESAGIEVVDERGARSRLPGHHWEHFRGDILEFIPHPIIDCSARDDKR